MHRHCNPNTPAKETSVRVYVAVTGDLVRQFPCPIHMWYQLNLHDHELYFPQDFNLLHCMGCMMLT